MHENKEKQQRALLVAVNTGEFDQNASMAELEELAKTAGAEVIGTIVQNLQSPINATYVGEGKLKEIKEFCTQQEIDLLIFDDELSGVQIRNIEEVVGIDVVDRTVLILDIFAMRALSNEGKLQVELAQQKYLLPRLIGMGKQLSRQGGSAAGSIGSRGPGETKLESDRRHIRKRVESLEQELAELALRRERVRKRREKNDAITIAIVGYTNVGKSTLLNLLTGADVIAENRLFQTLDLTARELKLNDGQTVVVIDTVGLIQRLPHQLIQAFKSTLEEAANADIILDVCDLSDERMDVQLEVTQKLLDELGCGDIPTITVYNKADKVDDFDREREAGTRSVYISAKNNEGIDDLMDCISKVLADSMKRCTLLVPYANGAVLDKIRKTGKILSEEYQNDGTFIEAIIDRSLLHLVQEYIAEE